MCLISRIDVKPPDVSNMKVSMENCCCSRIFQPILGKLCCLLHLPVNNQPYVKDWTLCQRSYDTVKKVLCVEYSHI